MQTQTDGVIVQYGFLVELKIFIAAPKLDNPRHYLSHSGQWNITEFKRGML